MIIAARPYPNIPTLLSSVKSLESSETVFYPLGRDALLSGLLALGLKKGDHILVPAYMCYSTLSPLRRYGFELVFIDVLPNLSLSIESIIEASDRVSVKALLLVHYFGFLQVIEPIAQVCESFNIKLVEDFSHSFLSQPQSNHSMRSHAQIFSMRKSLPVIDGGALKLNIKNKDSSREHLACISMLSDGVYIFKRLVEKTLTLLGINFYAQWVNISSKGNSSYYQNILNVTPCQPSWQLNQYLSSPEYLHNIKTKICKNFEQLSKNLRALGFEPLFDVPKAGEVPQALVLRDNTGKMVKYLRSHGVGAWCWPAEEVPDLVLNNPQQYPNAHYHSQTLVLLPIHQSIGQRQIDYVTKVLSKWQ